MSNKFNFNFNTKFDMSSKKKKDDDKYKIKVMKFAKRHYEVVKAVKNIINLKLPKQGEEYFLIAQNVFSHFAFILTILELEGNIKNLHISTYHTQKEITNLIGELINEGKIGTCRMIVSNMIGSWKPEIFQALINLQNSSNKKFQFCTAQSHAKISCIETEQGNYYVVSGSGNVTKANQKMEQYNMNNDKELYDFYVSWFLEQPTYETELL